MIDDQINMNNLGISHTNNSRNVNDLNSNIININQLLCVTMTSYQLYY